MKVVTEISRFALRGISRDEIVDAFKIFVILRGLDLRDSDGLSVHANAATIHRVSKALQLDLLSGAAAGFAPMLMGYPLIVEANYADDIFALILAAGENEYVLTLVFPKE